jgi:hypothetical protein
LSNPWQGGGHLKRHHRRPVERHLSAGPFSVKGTLTTAIAARRAGQMRFLLHVRFPHDEFNEATLDGSAGDKMKRIIEESKPESVYFAEYDGQRNALIFVDIKDASEMPKYSEPWFLLFNADVEFHPVMTPEDLGRAGLDGLGKKWS